MTRRIQAVVFDIGETLVDETRHWAAVARYAGIPDLTLMGVLGGLIERREHHRSLFGFLQIESIDPNIFGYQIEERDSVPRCCLGTAPAQDRGLPDRHHRQPASRSRPADRALSGYRSISRVRRRIGAFPSRIPRSSGKYRSGSTFATTRFSMSAIASTTMSSLPRK